ncbi:AAA family ATPase [Nannocystaceae bacterium ST9]
MKILAIRGRNLASLAGHFEVDFTKPPLDRAGLIAITGPTGAGKTTLLDAMCLALFDRTPRFGNRGGVLIGGVGDDPTSGLKANDVRGILRHGAVEGWAEVDFRGVDDRRFRARWEVRRARNKAEGRIQPQRLELLDGLTGKPIVGDRKQDVLEAIEQRLGLDFDQFRRSVLLAQGEFAAFLEANGAERAELLERMTGTGLYRTLGKAAWERSKQIERELDLLRREREALRMLDDDERERLRERAGTLDGQRRAIEREREQALAALEWHRRRAGLQAELDAAQVELGEHEQAFAGLAEIREVLRRIDRAAPLRARVELHQQRARELDERSGELVFLRGELSLVDEQRVAARDRLALDEQRLEQARERRRRIGLDLDRARELDARRGELGPRCERLRGEARELDEQIAKLVDESQALDRRIAGAAEDEARDRGWLDARPELATLADAWTHVRALIHKQARDQDRHRQIAARRRELAPRLDQRLAELGEIKQLLAQLKKQRAQAHVRVRKLERELDELPPATELRARARALERTRTRIAGLRELFANHQRCVAALAEARREADDQRVERAHRRAEVARVGAEVGRAEAAFDEARRALRQLEAVRDLASRRDDLRSGEACPLCGALEHPAVHGHGDPVDQAIDDQRARVELLLLRRDDLQREQGDHEARELVAGQRIAKLERQRIDLEAQRAALQSQWSEQRSLGVVAATPVEPEPGADQLLLLSGTATSSEPELPESLDDARTAPALWAVQDRHEARARALAQDQQQLDDLLAHQRQQQQKRDSFDEQIEQRRQDSDALASECATIQHELERAREQLEALDHELAERDEQLAAILIEPPPERAGESVWAGWRERLDAAFEAELEAAVGTVHARRRALEQTRQARRELDTRRVELDSRSAARRERSSTLGVELRELERSLAELDAARAALLEGRPVVEVQRELEAGVELSLRDRDASKDHLAAVERERQTHKARIAGVEARIEELRVAALEAEQALAHALREAAVERSELDEVLADPQWWNEAWQAGERERVEQARARLERQRTLVDERRRVLVAQLDAGAPSSSEAEAASLREQLDARVRTVSGELFEVEHRLRSDTEARARASELLPAMQATEQRAKIWARLRDAIGDATGTRFQQFAQSLTLELLLAQANAQLRELKPRYALARVPGHDLELQLVDRDLGDEIRSIRGLSGGEKFLVSLALALALASLAAEDCRIDSLFIDEGFGTLDSHSLDVAVGTLDALHGEGRQIGVISHVPGLAERVGVEIRVEPVSSGRSRVRVVGPG